MQNLDKELKARFPGVNFFPSAHFVQLCGDVELKIPSTAARRQGYSIVSDRHCQVLISKCNELLEMKWFV